MALPPCKGEYLRVHTIPEYSKISGNDLRLPDGLPGRECTPPPEVTQAPASVLHGELR
jgi:hypothetical protein